MRNLVSTMAYVNSNLVFSSARRFSKPISQAMPNGTVAVGGIVSLMMGIRALGSILTWKLVSVPSPSSEVSDAARIQKRKSRTDLAR